MSRQRIESIQVGSWPILGPLKKGLILLAFLFITAPQLAACGELMPIYPVQDSGKQGLGMHGWLDNDKVVFYSEQRAQAKPGDGPGLPPVLDTSNYICDTATGILNKAPSLEGAAKLCAQGKVITFLRKSPSEGEKWLVVTRINGQESVAPLVNAEWLNRFSCRYYDQKPAWIIPNHQTLPLMDGHGFLDWVPSEWPVSEWNKPLRFHLKSASEWICLPIGTREVWHNLVKYAPFRNSYLLYPSHTSIPRQEKKTPSDHGRKSNQFTSGGLQLMGGSRPKQFLICRLCVVGPEDFSPPAKASLFILTRQTIWASLVRLADISLGMTE